MKLPSKRAGADLELVDEAVRVSLLLRAAPERACGRETDWGALRSVLLDPSHGCLARVPDPARERPLALRTQLVRSRERATPLALSAGIPTAGLAATAANPRRAHRVPAAQSPPAKAAHTAGPR